MSKQMRKILTILSLALILSIVATSFGIAYTRGVRGIGLLGISFFFTMATIIVLGQLIPAGVLFSLVVKSFLSSHRRDGMPVHA